jgi:phytoene dehydrogenase-like protein
MTVHHSSVVKRPFPVVVVGGGLSGLIASTLVARAGTPVVLLEKAAAVGGRAASRTKDGFIFNLGPHALYRAGHLRKTLKALGVEIRGAAPGANGGFVLLGGRRHTLPAGLASLLTTGALTLHGKFELARLQSRLPAVDTASIQRQTLASWLDSQVADAGVRGLMEMLVRVTTFTHDPEHQSAGAAIEQLQLALRASVLYLDGGWQTIVDGLRRAAVDSGVRIVQGAHAVALDRSAERVIDAVRLADGTVIGASAVILGGTPADVDTLASTTFGAGLPPPIRVASLDVALRSLPKTNATVAFGVDAPLYFSVHSAVAALAPAGGAMIHVSKYLRPGESAGRDVEHELEALMDTMQPGWRDRLVSRQYLPSLTVAHTELTAAIGGVNGRPSSRLPAFDNVWIAGDWVGAHGQLSDAAAASASDAAAGTLAALKGCATSTTKDAAADSLVAQPFRAASAGTTPPTRVA